jgi:peptidoglycan/LPS O-acetylase OafA/YrhL
MEQNTRNEKIRLIIIGVISLVVIVTGAMFAIGSFRNKEIMGGVLGIIIALIILIFAVMVYKRGNKDMKNGFPLQDERSKRVLEKASSLSFYVSLYLLLLVGFLSDDLIPFRDISQATSVSVGCMALLFLVSWIYYNKKQI